MRYFAALFLLLSLSVTGQNKPAAQSKGAEYGQEGLVYERLNTRYEFAADGSSTRENSVRIRVQSDAGLKQAGLLVFGYQRDFDTTALTVRVYKPDGKVIETPADSALDMPAEITRQAPMYSDLFEKHVTVRGLEVGDALEYTFSSRVRPLVPGQFWLNYNFSSDAIVLAEELQVSAPASVQVKVKSDKIQPTISTSGNTRTYLWKSSSLKRKTEKESKAELRASVKKVSDIQITSFASWEEIRKWYNGLLSSRVVVTPEISAKAGELTKGLTTTEQKVQALYKFVATRFRYTAIAFGIGRYQPHSAAEVLESGFGDCKDKHTLLAALLKAVGIPAEAALITYNRAFDADVPSVAQFSHVITRVPLRDKVAWLDTTLEVAPFDYLPAALRDHYTLLTGEKPALVKTPAEEAARDSANVNVKGKLDEKGMLTADFDVEASGDTALALRMAFRQVSEAQWGELVQRISYSQGYAGVVSNVKLKAAPEDTSADFAYSYTYKREEFGDWANRRILTACTSAGLPDGGDKSDEPEPVWFGSKLELDCESDIELPAGYEAVLPTNKDSYKPFGEFHVSYDAENHHLKSERSLTLKVVEVPREQVLAYRDFRKDFMESEEFITLNSQDRSRMVPSIVAGNVNGFPRVDLFTAKGDNPEANHAYDEGVELMKSRGVAAAQEKFEEAARLDPKHPRAWAALGMTYLVNGNVERALELFRRQLKEAPSPEIYKSLGMTLMQIRRNDEAVDVWKEAQKAYPDDRDMPANLGSALGASGRYQEAAAALETAVKRNPDSANLLWQLSRAYKNTGKKDEAVVALHKAADIDGTALMWNNLAYELADMNRDLDEAMRLAQQAVSEVQEKASKVSLSTLSVPDLETMPSLASYWDTLGWVYFRRGDIDKAEPFIRASWELTQSGEVADHLGQIMEAKKKTSLAQDYYAMAIASSRSFKDAEKHLQTAMPAAATRNAKINKAREELGKIRTYKVPRAGAANGSGEFFVVFDANGAVEDAKFIDGNSSLPPMLTPLKKVHFGYTIPSASDAKFVRRGIMMCTPASSNCDFVVLTVDTVRSLF
jgi:tetratricopeptide (TPR) repeat protein/transglutaminase-like putative cysteine protease